MVHFEFKMDAKRSVRVIFDTNFTHYIFKFTRIDTILKMYNWYLM